MNSQTNSFYQQTMPLAKPIQSAKVIPLYPIQTKSLLDDKRSYMILHAAVGTAMGASFLMVAVALYTQTWLLRSAMSMAVTICVYGVITYYYHGIKSKKTSLMYRGITIVILSAASVLLMVWLL